MGHDYAAVVAEGAMKQAGTAQERTEEKLRAVVLTHCPEVVAEEDLQQPVAPVKHVAALPPKCLNCQEATGQIVRWQGG
jgi:hypothetical protein